MQDSRNKAKKAASFQGAGGRDATPVSFFGGGLSCQNPTSKPPIKKRDVLPLALHGAANTMRIYLEVK